MVPDVWGLGQVGFRPEPTCPSARQGPFSPPCLVTQHPQFPAPHQPRVAAAVCIHGMPLLKNRPWLLVASSAKGSGLNFCGKAAPLAHTLPEWP